MVTDPNVACRDDDPSLVFLGLQMSDTSMVVQEEREALLRRSEFALYDTARAYSLVFLEGMDAVFLRIPPQRWECQPGSCTTPRRSHSAPAPRQPS